jgi:hypothetical protein
MATARGFTITGQNGNLGLFHIFDKLGVSSRVELVLYAASSTKRSQPISVQNDRQESESAGGAGIAGKLLTYLDQGSGGRSSRSRTRKPKA